MKVNPLLVTVSLGLLSLGFQAFSCELTPAQNTSPSPTPEATSFLPIAPLTPLPRLSEAEITSLQTELSRGIDDWLGLASLDKVAAPPPLSTALQDYREAWSVVSVEMVSFLGSWYSSDAYPYSLHVFPSKTSGQVCVLEFKPEWSLDIFNEATGQYGKDVISEQILSFSIATVEGGQLRSSQVRSVGSATAVARYAVGKPYQVLFMALADDQGSTHVVALSSPPTLPDSLPEALVAPISQALSNYGCTTDLAPPELKGRQLRGKSRPNKHFGSSTSLIIRAFMWA